MKHAGTDRRSCSVAAAAACALAALAGCASKPGQPATPAKDEGPAARAPAPVPGLASLLRLADAQAKRPVQRTMEAPLPPGLEPALAERVPVPDRGGDPRAWMSLSDAVTAFASADPRPAGAAAPASPRDAELALRHYVAGRERLMEDDAQGAAVELRAATRLDPGSGEPWRALGEALMRTGAKSDAIAAFRSAAQTGLEDARVLEVLGRDALDRGDHEAAAKLLARASLASPERLDPVLPQVIDIALSRALTASGYISAARDALVRAGERPMQLSASTRYGAEFSAIFRRQGELWRDVGDACCRLGDYTGAVEAYEQSSQLPTLDDQRVTARIAFAALRAGRPATAAIAVLRDIVAAGGRAGEEDIRLLKYLAEHGFVGAELAAALTEYRAALPSPLAPTLDGSLTRARAAVAPAPEARTILREYLARNPSDLGAAAALLGDLPDAGAAAAEAAAFVAVRPLSAGAIAEAVIRTKLEFTELGPALAAASPRPAAELLRAYVHSRRGETGAAADLAARLEGGQKYAAAAALAKIELGVDAGRPELTAAGLAQLGKLKSQEATRATAKAMLLLQRSRAGLAAIEPLLKAPSVAPADRLEDLLLAANLALSVGEGDAAERWLLEAAAIDRTDDRAPSGLLALYGPGGLKADQARLNQVVRDLRQSIPDSRTLRLVRAQDLLRRSLLTQAETEAELLAAEDPGDTVPIDVLVASWLRRTGTEKDEAVARGRKWLEARLQRRPASPALWAGMTALLTGSGKANEAEASLRAALEKGGGPDISRLLERVLRSELGRGAEAGEMALKRLQGRTRTPGEAIELAETYTHLERTAEAAAALREGLPAEVALSGKQEFQVLALAMEAAKRAEDGANAATRGPAVEILDLAAARGLVLPPDLHERRLVLLAATPEADIDRLLDAAALTGHQHEKLVDAGYVVMSQALGAAGRDAVEIAFIARAAAARPTADVFAEWFRVIADVGRAAHARDLVAAAGSAGKLRELFQKLGGEAAPAWDVRAEIVYALGTFFAGKQKDDEAAAAYELALEYEPGHPWVCNNLGYMLADKGVQLERAADLLERAHAALPQEASIADSLGWLRYKQGIIEDRVDPATGAVQVRGAVTLLRGAVESSPDRGNAVHLDHLGDALWLAGNREEAQRCWQRAESLASQEIRASERAGQGRGSASGRQLSPAALQAQRALREAARAKRRAAAAGEAVMVAPQIGRAGVPEPARPAPGPDSPAGQPAGQPGGPGF